MPCGDDALRTSPHKYNNYMIVVIVNFLKCMHSIHAHILFMLRCQRLQGQHRSMKSATHNQNFPTMQLRSRRVSSRLARAAQSTPTRSQLHHSVSAADNPRAVITNSGEFYFACLFYTLSLPGLLNVCLWFFSSILVFIPYYFVSFRQR